MELQTAIEILEYHQEWRLGKRENMIYEPQKITEALNIVLSEVKKLRLGAVSGSLQINWDDVYEEANHRSPTAFDEYVKSIYNDH